MAYQGIIAELPVGIDGLVGTKNLAKTQPSQLVVARNVSYEQGTVQKEGGAAKYNSTAISNTPTVLAGHDWHPVSATQRMVVYTDDGKLLKDTGNGSFGTTLKTGLSTTATGVFAEGGKEAAASDRKLFFFNGSNPVQVLAADGATTSDLATPPADWGTPAATATITVTDAANISAGATIVLKDTAGSATTFTATTSDPAGALGFTIGGSRTNDEVADNIAVGAGGILGINAQSAYSAPNPAANVVTVTQATAGSAGNQTITSSDATRLAVTGFSGGGENYPAFGLIHEGRLWGGGNANDAHRLYYSMTTDHENFTGSGSGTLSIFPGEGEKIVGAMSFKGVIVCWKAPRGVYVVDTTATAVADWKVSRLSFSIGGVSPLGATMIDNDLLFLDDDGNVHLLSSVTEFGNLGTSNLSQVTEMNPFIRDNVNLAKLSRSQSVFYPAKREAHFAIAGTGSTVNNRRLVVDFNVPNRPRFRWSDRDVSEAIWLRKDSDGIPRLTIGDDAGFVWKLDQEDRGKDAGAYSSEFETGQLDFGHLDPQLASKRKLGDFLELVFEPVGNHEVDVAIKWDGDVKQNLSYLMQETGSKIGTGSLGGFILGREGVFSIKKRITGSGKRFAFVAKNNRALQNFSVARAFLYFRVGSEREA